MGAPGMFQQSLFYLEVVVQHHFEISDAREYGIEKAVIMNNFRFWLTKNKANRKNIVDGRVWTYNSAQALCELFPYWSRQKIARMLRELEEAGVLVSGIYNKKGYDRTKWYSLNDEQFIVQDETLHCSDLNNGMFKDEQSIPDVKPDSKPDKNTYTPEFLSFWNSYPRNTNKHGAYKAWQTRLKAGVSPDLLIKCAKNYAAQSKKDKTDIKYCLHAATFLGPQERYEDYTGTVSEKSIPMGWYVDPKTEVAYRDGKKVGHYDGGRYIEMR
jgi:hypothetical protein